MASPATVQSSPTLPPGHYYWNGSTLQFVDTMPRAAPPMPPSEPVTPSPITSLAGAMETLLICGGASLFLVLLTLRWETGPFAGLAHALSILPVLLIDVVYRRLTTGKLVLGHQVSFPVVSALLGRDRQSRDVTATQPWWLRTVFYLACVQAIMQLTLFLARATDPGVRAEIAFLTFVLVVYPLGFAVGSSKARFRKTSLLLVVLLSPALLIALDPVQASLLREPRLFSVQGLTQSDIAFGWAFLIGATAPIGGSLAYYGYFLARFYSTNRRPVAGARWEGPRWWSQDRLHWWDGYQWQASPTLGSALPIRNSSAAPQRSW